MKRHDFINGLRVLRSIDHHEVPNFGNPEWVAFRDYPYNFMMKCTDGQAKHIWAAMCKRMDGAEPDA